MPTPDDRLEDELDELDPEVVEDLEVDEEAEDVEGGTSLGCRMH